MAQDIRALFKNSEITPEKMPKNHQQRFIKKLNKALPKASHSKFKSMLIAASVVGLLGISFGVFKYFQPQPIKSNLPSQVAVNKALKTKTLGDISPGLKKIENYYIASINLELSKISYTAETKDLFDDYIEQLNELDKEYKRLLKDLTESGPNELTINALIDNLKLRLNLLHRLKAQLKKLGTHNEEITQSI